MARDVNGNYSLPAGNPVVVDDLIEADWANTTMDDIATAMQDSLSRSGSGGMLAGLKAFAGTINAPGYAWSLETASGWYRAGAGDFRYAVSAIDIIKVTSAGLEVLKALNLAVGANIASAATINLTTATGNLVHITGTTQIDAVTLGAGMMRQVIFDGILTLTHHATNNNLPGGANITTAAGDRALYWSDGTTVYCVSYMPASGYVGRGGVATSGLTMSTARLLGRTTAGSGAVEEISVSGATLSGGALTVAVPAAASQAEQEAGTEAAKYVAPAVQQFHPSACKGWVRFSNAAVIAGSYNVTSVTDVGAGFWSVNWATDFSSVNYCALACNNSDRTGGVPINAAHVTVGMTNFAAGVTPVNSERISDGSTGVEPTNLMVAAFGDQ